MKKYIQTAVALTAVAVMALAVTGCTKKSAAGKYKITIGQFTTNAFLNPLIEIALEEGYFDHYNVDVNIEKVDRSGAFESLSINKINATYSELIPELSYGAQGSDVTLFAGTQSGGMAVMAYKPVADEVRDITNWKGKTIGVKLLSTSEMIAKNVLSKQYGLVIDQDVQFKLFDGDASLIAALTKGVVDIGFVGQHYVESAQAQGITYLYPETAIQPDYVCCRHTANGTNLQKDRDAYVALLKGEIRAYQYYLTHREEAIATVVKHSGLEKDYVERYMYDKDTSQDTSYNPDPNYNGVAGVYDVLVNWNYVETNRPLPEFYDISVYADALTAVIAEFPDEQFYKDMWNYFVANNNEYPDFAQTYSL